MTNTTAERQVPLLELESQHREIREKVLPEVMRVIDDLANDQNLQVAMVIVTHDIPAVKRIADVVHLLNKGKVVYSGPAGEALAPGGPAAVLE